jgi:pimeloyl-ACP methyl ester carboxylesterase
VVTRVLFFHGLEGSPEGHKPTHLRAQPALVVFAPRIDTAPLIARLAAGELRPGELPGDIVEPIVDAARAALEDARADVVVGSSFGGAVAMELARRKLWRGPMVLLAPAGTKLLGIDRLEHPARVAIVHGAQDDVVPSADSVTLAERSPGEVELTLVEDDHRLRKTVDDGAIERCIAWALAPPAVVTS